MSTRKRHDIEKGLSRKGFVMRVDGDHQFLDFEQNGKRYFFTKTSHGEREIGDPLLSKMARQCHLNKEDFLNLIDCPMSKEEYENILKKQGIN